MQAAMTLNAGVGVAIILGAAVACSGPHASRSTLGAGDAEPSDAASISDGPAAPDDAGRATSCNGADAGPLTCGSAADSCCASLLVPGGTFYRSFDGVTFPQQESPATVSSLRMDRYEVTVGRFRRFVDAIVAGWRPAPGAGRHAHLNGGKGLREASDGDASAAYESGWNSSWTAQLAGSAAAWNAALACGPSHATWTPEPNGNEALPITCETWFEAYAFCIWDAGFLPSNAEWNYAAAGGADQRAYPWSVPSASAAIDCAHANYDECDDGGGKADLVGSTSPSGDGRWGQTDLAGNVAERVLDVWTQFYPSPCVDCTVSGPSGSRVGRGGSFVEEPHDLLVGFTDAEDPSARDTAIGFRCARVP